MIRVILMISARLCSPRWAKMREISTPLPMLRTVTALLIAIRIASRVETGMVTAVAAAIMTVHARRKTDIDVMMRIVAIVKTKIVVTMMMLIGADVMMRIIAVVMMQSDAMMM
jgi:hypothetical protein